MRTKLPYNKSTSAQFGQVNHYLLDRRDLTAYCDGMANLHTVGGRLAYALEATGVSQKDLAEKLGKSASAISHYVRNTKVPTGKAYSQIAGLLDINLDWLMYGKGTPPKAVLGLQAMKEAGWRMRPAYADYGRDYGNPAWLVFVPTLRSVMREVTQNVRDAASGNGPTTLIVRLHYVTGERLVRFRQACGWEELEPHVLAAATEKTRFASTLRHGLEAMERGLVVATFNDFGTVGLLGDDYVTDSPTPGSRQHFVALVRHTFDSQKDTPGAGGSYGLGKNAAIASSQLRTVFYDSTLTQPVNGKTEHRFIGRTDLGARTLPDGTAFAGPGWFGEPIDDKAVMSTWGDRARLESLFLYRDREQPDAPGTSILVPAFYDPTDEDATVDEMAEALAEAAGTDFWPAITDDKLHVVVETYDNDNLRRRIVVDPSAYRPEAVAMYDAFKVGETKDNFDEEGGVVRRDIVVSIPRREANGTSRPASDHTAVLLITRADGKADDVNCVAGFRSPGMIVQERRFVGIGPGIPNFRAVLLVGSAAEPTTPAGEIAELFFTAAEPPSHDKWTFTAQGLSELYHKPKRTLSDFNNAVLEQLRDALQTAHSRGTAGPEAILKHFTEPVGPDDDDEDVPKPPPPPPPAGRVRALRPYWKTLDGTRYVAVTLKVPSRVEKIVTPALICRYEDGGGAKMRIRSVAEPANCDVLDDFRIRVSGSRGDASVLLEPDWDDAGLDPAYSVLSFDLAKQVDVKESA